MQDRHEALHLLMCCVCCGLLRRDNFSTKRKGLPNMANFDNYAKIQQAAAGKK
jgi:hypothetical protein